MGGVNQQLIPITGGVNQQLIPITGGVNQQLIPITGGVNQPFDSTVALYPELHGNRFGNISKPPFAMSHAHLGDADKLYNTFHHLLGCTSIISSIISSSIVICANEV